jgi:hypothetical protein
MPRLASDWFALRNDFFESLKNNAPLYFCVSASRNGGFLSLEDATGLRRMVAGLVSHRREIGLSLVVLLLIGNIVALQGTGATIATGEKKKNGDITGLGPGGTEELQASASAAAEEARKAAVARAKAIGKSGSVGVPVPKSGTIPPGIDYAKQEIKVVYYWADSSRNSQFLPPGTPGDSVDDGKAFDALYKFVNKHAKGTAELMGTKINMGNWKIVPTIVTMNTPEAINSETVRIAKEIKPFAAITVRGSLGTSTCPAFAAAGINTYATNLPYVYNIGKSTNGYCVPISISLDQQIEATINYMTWHKTQAYNPGARAGTGGASCPPAQTTCARVYGFLYSEYPGLKELGPEIVSRLRGAGLNIPDAAVASMKVGLSDAAQQAPGIRDKLSAAGVNTVIMPDGGSSLAFTHGAGTWRPDYYVWPCSGQDTTGYTRLLPPEQWDNAQGLSCYDNTFDADLTIDRDDRDTQWYKAYKEMAPNSEAPSSSYLVYAALQPLVEAVSRLGSRDFTEENYRAALNEFDSYRYDGIKGRTGAGDNILLLMGKGVDNSLWGDVARVAWSPAAENPFEYLDGHRYKSNQSFP